MGNAANATTRAQRQRQQRPAEPRPAGRLQCPFCNSYDVARLFVASLGMDSCQCAVCGATWDEERADGRFRGSSDDASIVMRRN